jgi:hypothetical protein
MTQFLPMLCLFATGVLAGCGGGDASVGGTVSGLPTGTSVTLQLNGANDTTVSANGSFWFSKTVEADDTYSVTVLTQPTGATCSVANASGTIDSNGSDVSSVTVTCVVNASITGTVSGLASGGAVTLSNGSVSLAIASNGVFAFPGILSNGTTYSVTVSVQPTGQTCTVSNGTGSVVSGTQTSVAVSCT